jgi:hypothetical protein
MGRYYYSYLVHYGLGGGRGRDRNVVGFTTTTTISAYHH